MFKNLKSKIGEIASSDTMQQVTATLRAAASELETGAMAPMDANPKRSGMYNANGKRAIALFASKETCFATATSPSYFALCAGTVG